MADINLSQQDIDYIARVVDTEVPASLARTNPAEYERMVQGVVDTITNRMESEKFPGTAVGVLNQNRAFSKITGPSRLSPYGSVQRAPQASPRAQAAVYDYVAARAQGAPPTAPGALNYANPNFSDRRNLTGWINPMIEAGAKALGVGRNTHYHGTAPGLEPVGYYTLSAEAMPAGNIPTPTPRDAITPAYGLMGAIDPIAPAPVERGLLGPVTEPAAPTPTSVAYGGLTSPRIDTPMRTASIEKTGRASPAAFDMGRFGPAPVQETPVAAFAPDKFDIERFGPQVRAPTAPSSFDVSRFGPAALGPTPVDASVASLQKGLLGQVRDVYGALPEIPPSPAPGALLGGPLLDVNPVAAVPGYVEPQPTAPVQAPTIAEAPAAISVQPAQPAMSAAQRTFNERSALGAPSPSLLGPQMARDAQRQMATRNTLGALGGALLGGALLGPVGGLLGGYMGRSYANKTYSPPAPEPVAGQPRGTAEGGGVSYSDLNDYGRDAYSSSRDFRDSIDAGGIGLY